MMILASRGLKEEEGRKGSWLEKKRRRTVTEEEGQHGVEDQRDYTLTCITCRAMLHSRERKSCRFERRREREGKKPSKLDLRRPYLFNDSESYVGGEARSVATVENAGSISMLQ